MIIKNLIGKYRYILFFSFLLLIIAASAVISPVLVSNEKKNWDLILTDKIEQTENFINQAFEKRYLLLKDSFKNLNQEINNQSLLTVNDRKKIFDKLSYYNDRNLSVQIYDDSLRLIAWNDRQILENVGLLKLNSWIGQAFFSGEKLITYLSFTDTLHINYAKYFLLLSLPVEKSFTLPSHENTEENLTDSLSQALSVEVQIEYSQFAKPAKDGRKYSFALLNNFNNKIGMVSFDKPAIEASLNQIKNDIWTIQSIVIIIAFLGFGFFSRIYLMKIKSRIIQLIISLLYLAALRILFFYFEIPSSIFNNSLTDASNFSSQFGYGIVRSPLEFTITVLLLLAGVLLCDKYADEYFTGREGSNKGWLNFAVIFIPIIFLFLLILRALGASIRSVIFDSTIRYFREFSIWPGSSSLLMCINILILGYCVVLFSMMLFNFVYKSIPSKARNRKYFYLAILFIIIQFAGWLFDVVQSEPQGTPLIRFIFISILFILTFFVLDKRKKTVIGFVSIAFAASLITVSYLTYYNSEIERESLKTTAQEITRTDESLVEFMVYQTLAKIKQDENIISSFNDGSDLSSDAFVAWTNSMLYREGIRSAINFYDSKKNFIGGFQSSSLINNQVINELLNSQVDSLEIKKQVDVYGDRLIFYGSAPVGIDNDIAGYVTVTAIYDEDFFNYPELPKFLSPSRAGISSAVSFDKLKIFDFHNAELVRSYGDISLSESDQNILLNASFSSHNEAWMNLDLNNENHLVYLLKINNNSKNKIIAVALEGKNFSWNLSDFFKIFFIHTFIILILLLIYALFKFNQIIELLFSYKFRLIGAFLIVSIVPLMLVAVYFRNLTESKNNELVEKRLIELAQQVESYINYYYSASSINEQTIYSKATNDLNISFSLFDGRYFTYGSDKIYSDIGLLPQFLSGNVYSKCVLGKNQNLFIKEPFENIPVNNIYHQAKIGSKEYIIQVSDMFNRVAVPLSDVELDIFLFGIFSLALILLIVFSTLLAEQISSPIRKITNATKSVGSGDLNVEVNYNARGEIRELVDGFNGMVKKIKQSQAAIAEMERETAWKEMAKQVAHEIKNPLTPMKLNVQQLITAYKDKSAKFDSIFEKVTTTIISQIEILKNIASEFSNFARMPRLNIEKINAVAVIRKALDLFAEEKRVILFESQKDEIIIEADKDQLERTIINLVRNSIQADSKNISVALSVDKENCILRVKDDGTGISKELMPKVFDENFTTKKHGMGIGLSIAKKYIESIGGNVSLENSLDNMTVFLIIIPLSA
jgi:two-component system, NtrC family, nitrogen regulation sensor histidine kinase NtrY